MKVGDQVIVNNQPGVITAIETVGAVTFVTVQVMVPQVLRVPSSQVTDPSAGAAPAAAAAPRR